eukprot:1065492-Rhodomonas_salina.3
MENVVLFTSIFAYVVMVDAQEAWLTTDDQARTSSFFCTRSGGGVLQRVGIHQEGSRHRAIVGGERGREGPGSARGADQGQDVGRRVDEEGVGFEGCIVPMHTLRPRHIPMKVDEFGGASSMK